MAEGAPQPSPLRRCLSVNKTRRSRTAGPAEEGGKVEGDQDRGQALIALASLQQRSNAALLVLARAGERPPDEAYERFLDAARQYLAATVAYEERWPGSFSLQTISLPLVQQLSIYADYRQAEGDREYAERCRHEI